MRDVVSITDHIKEFSIESKILKEYLEPEVTDRTTILLVWHQKIDKDFLKKYKNVRAIVRYGVGIDNIDLETCKGLNITVCNTPDYGIDEVSDSAVAMILALGRRIKELENFALTNEESWTGAKINFNMKRINCMKIGIIGLGRIGGSVARKLKVFSPHISFYDPYLTSGIEKTFDIHRYFKLNELLENSDIVTVHTPLTPETKGMINKHFIDSLKKEAVLINVSRGPIVEDNSVILEALKENTLSGYGTDVFTSEPPKKDDELYNLCKTSNPLSNRIIINPHTSYYSVEALKECREKASLNVLNIIKNSNIKNKII
tara:strand:- start:855 stop:1805 length:951 start_codon:yes stop_codon:yes gene_type:complete